MKIIGITGGKGGTGKSTVATALAYGLAKENRVLLVDADVDCPDDHLLLDIERKFHGSVEQRIPSWDLKRCIRCGLCGEVCKTNAIVSIKGQDPIFLKQQCNGCGSCVFKCPVNAISWDRKVIGDIYTGKNNDINLLSGELKTNEPVSEFVVNSLNKIVADEKDNYDFVIIDTAAGTHCPVIAALEMCDYVIAVTEPTPLGKHDLELILQLLKILDIDSDIVLNRSDIGDGQLISELAKRYGLAIVCEIPYSKDIAENYSKGRPIIHEQISNLLEVITR
ncbi:MAG: AAA family ATPase [Nanohaloarchaea archaeon]|nr:AAA family ATPase [Candidatus Nanohaloarchaea archaeon]